MRGRKSVIWLFMLCTMSVSAQWTQHYFRGYVNLYYGDSQQIFSILDSSRIYRSTDAGATWSERNSGLPGSALINDFVLQGNTITVAAEASSNAAKGLYRSTDLGVTWSKMTTATVQNYNLLRLIDTTWFAGFINYAGSPLMVSTNGGDAWTACTGLLTSYKVESVFKSSNTLFASTDQGLFKSADRGFTWSKVTTSGLPGGATLSSMFLSGTGQILGYTNSYSLPALYVSTNNGVDWTASPQTGMPADMYIWDVAQSGNSFYAVGYAYNDRTRLYVSSNLGSTWTEINTSGLPGFSDRYFQHAKQLLVIGSTLYAATARGIYKTTDNGTTWSESSNGMRYNGTFNRLAGTSSYLFGLSNSQLFQTSVYPGTFSELTNYPLRNTYALDIAALNNVLVAAGEQKLYRSTNFGVNWDSVSNLPFPLYLQKLSTGNGKFYAYVQKISNNARYLLSSTPTGTSWDTLKITYTDMFTTVTPAFNRVYASSNYNIFESNAANNAWTLYTTSSLPSGYNIMTSYPIDSNRVIISFYGNPTTPMYYTTNRGTTWIKSTITYPNTTADTLPPVRFFFNVGNYTLAGTDKGMYITKDKGATWLQYQANMGPVEINSICNTGKYIVVGTSYFSAWFIPVSTVGVEDNNAVRIDDFRLLQNYPNPFNPETTIKFSLAAAGAVSLKVYDALGREVADLLNGYQQAGEHSVRFKAASLPSGLYFYRLRTSGSEVVKKMTLLK